MKIIQVQTQAEAGGAQRISDMVGAGLRERGHDVRTVFMYRKTDVYDDDAHADFILRERPRGLFGQLRAAYGLISYLRRARPEVVFSYQHFGNVFGTIGGRWAGARRLVANQSGAPLRNGLRGVATALDKVMGTVGFYHDSVVNSAWTAEQFANYPRLYRARLRRIDHGVLGPSVLTDKGVARARFGLPIGGKLVVSSGRLTIAKNQIALVEALQHLPDVHLAIAGDGPARAEIEERAARLGLTGRLHLVGEVQPDRIFQFIAAGDVFAFPSLQETFGLSVAEAAIAGVPVVASDIAVLREVLSTAAGEPAALFASPADPVAFAGAISRVLDDRDLAARLSAAGRQLAEKYAPSRMVAGYEELLSG